MTITEHALKRINERITKMNRLEATSFAEKETRQGNESYTIFKDGQLFSKVINNGIVYIVEWSNLKSPVLITVYLNTENECKEW